MSLLMHRGCQMASNRATLQHSVFCGQSHALTPPNSSSSVHKCRRSHSRRSRARHAVVAAAWGGFGRQQPLAPGSLFVFGLGYSGLGAASYFQSLGWSVAGTCRSPEKCERLAQRGIQTFHFDPSEYSNLGGRALDSLRHATHVLSTVPPEDDTLGIDPVVMAHAQQLSEHADKFKWVGYISSTSVYGDWEGEWVDEESELRAAGGKGWSRVMAEHEWLALHDSFGLPAHIFRCGGIYGPRRSAIEALQRGGGGPNSERRGRQRYTARCHVYDICQTLEASMRHPRPGAAYNIADDDPAPRAEVMEYAAELLQRRAAGLPLAAGVRGAAGGNGGDGGEGHWGVPTVSSQSSGSSGSYDSGDEHMLLHSAERLRRGSARVRRGDVRQAAGAAAAAVRESLAEKRVCNRRIKQELGVQLAFPTYREGLAAIAAGDMRPFEWGQ